MSYMSEAIKAVLTGPEESSPPTMATAREGGRRVKVPQTHLEILFPKEIQ